MKFLMIGLGSIGQRHLRNIKRVYGDDAEILAYRVRGLDRTFSDTMEIRENVSLEEEFHITTYHTLMEALEQKPDFAFVTNPTKMHVPTAISCLRADCHVFMEKPISDNVEGVSELIDMLQRKGISRLFVGYQNRFHPAIKEMKKCLEAEELGRVLSVRSVVGERLTTMHTYEDYKRTYMARRDLGGGVVTNQMVHELDCLYYLFGMPRRVYAIGGTLGTLEIDVEDTCEAIFTMRTERYDFPISVHADFYQSPPSRFIKVVGEKGQMTADLIHNTFVKTISDETTEIAYTEFDRNDMFIEELKLFVEGAKKEERPAIPLTDGIASLRMMEAVKNSMKNGGKLNEFTV